MIAKTPNFNSIMKLKSLTILMIAFLSTSIVYAQDNDSIKMQPLKGKSYITFNLLSPVDQFVPRWRIGYIKSINQKWKAGIEFGYGNKILAFADIDDDNEDDYQLWEIRPELYYMLNPLKKTQKYISAELFYIHHKDILHYGVYQPKDANGVIYDQANYFRQKYGMHLNYGYFIHTGKRFGLNVYSGMGFRIRNNNYSNVINPETTDSTMLGEIEFYRDYEGVKFGVDFSLGLKLFLH